MLNITRLFLSTIIAVTFLNQFWMYDLVLDKKAITENYQVRFFQKFKFSYFETELIIPGL
jgi:hypothetical protein